MKIYHNPRCSKSRQTLTLLQENGIAPEIKLYLQEEVTAAELKNVLNALGMKASELVRKGEQIYKEKYKEETFSEAEWLTILIANPKLIERPIVIKGDKAVLGRPPENVLNLIGGV